MSKYDYDFLVIGGGSGGVSASKTAAKLGKTVCVCDFVKPSPYGTTWGVGGTCVNVGCIPKKLYHTAGIIGHQMEMSKTFGWNFKPDDFEKEKKKYLDWKTLRGNIVNHVKSLNEATENTFMENFIDYKNGFATFVDEHTVEVEYKDGKKEKVSAEFILMAMGGRPRFPDIPGAKEYGLSSDDIFHLEEDPGKTCVVGASYIALETAGFLNSIGRDVTVLVRSIVLRGFDRTCADKIHEAMMSLGTKFIQPASPTKIEKLENGKLRVHFKNNENGDEGSDVFDSVFFAIGRTPLTKEVKCESVGVKLDKGLKVIVNDEEQTSVKNIYALGDVINHQELTPVAVQTGRLLVKRLFEGSTIKMDYEHVATTVFTPLEYGTIGYSEEKAGEEFGPPFIKSFETEASVLEYAMDPHMSQFKAYFKIITYKFDDDKIIGFHYLGPNAGEIAQAFSIAMKLGVKKDQLDSVVGIHPTCAEAMTSMYELKKEASGGCST